MDDKTLTAVATSLALVQRQSQCLMLLLERYTRCANPGAPIKEEFQQLISDQSSQRLKDDLGIT
jgi:hypothetical protein